ncbi:MAG: HD domain-containing protein [Deltaproteobacteria bacterium]|nr:HD domain-containing protein [Deltaproteobacteria bacterium]MCB9785680.1 HD domain-containing protein [Deltaproteobacteria bacterium]
MQLAMDIPGHPRPPTDTEADPLPELTRELARERMLRGEAEECLAATRLNDELKTELLRALVRSMATSTLPPAHAPKDAAATAQTLADAAEAWRRSRDLAERGLAWFEWLDRSPRDIGGRTDLGELLRLMAAHTRDLAPAGVEVELRIPDRLPAVLGRRRHLVEVLREVFDNATRFARGEQPVRIAALVDGRAVCVSVIDDGPGFDPAIAPLLLRPFSRAQRSGDGGLGLALAASIMRAHGGSLELTSPGLGMGAEVRLRFPAARTTSTGSSRVRPLPEADNDHPAAPAPRPDDAATRQALMESQLLLYARDLTQVIARERGRRNELENAHRQMARFAQDLKRALFTEKLRANELDEAQRGTLTALLRAARFKDQETAAHIERLSHYSRLIGLHVGMDAEEADLLFAAAPMHDIGKIGVPDAILIKPGKLDEAEWAEMRRHPEHGAGMLRGSSSELIQLAADIALTHHERWDGTGYPNGLVGQRIPLVGRIVMLGDIYDALRSPRPYKAEMTHEQASDIILNGDGRTSPTHFDPALLDAFRDLATEMAGIYDGCRDTI